MIFVPINYFILKGQIIKDKNTVIMIMTRSPCKYNS